MKMKKFSTKQMFGIVLVMAALFGTLFLISAMLMASVASASSSSLIGTAQTAVPTTDLGNGGRGPDANITAWSVNDIPGGGKWQFTPDRWGVNKVPFSDLLLNGQPMITLGQPFQKADGTKAMIFVCSFCVVPNGTHNPDQWQMVYTVDQYVGLTLVHHAGDPIRVLYTWNYNDCALSGLNKDCSDKNGLPKWRQYPPLTPTDTPIPSPTVAATKSS